MVNTGESGKSIPMVVYVRALVIPLDISSLDSVEGYMRNRDPLVFVIGRC